MALVSLNNVSLRFGGPPLLDDVSLHLHEGDRLCLLGRNGSGKTSLLRVVAGFFGPDDGQVALSRGTEVSLLEQESDTQFTGSALQYCLSRGAPALDSERNLTQIGMDPGAEFNLLSGGGQRKVMLAATLARDADVILLDEPTNHLDIDSILWLEEHLRRQVKTLVVVTHDRAFARGVANRVAELDRGALYTFDCGFDEFLRRRDEQLTAEERERGVADKRLEKEEAWLQRGVKARRTRDEGRVRALVRMREEYRERRSRPGQVNLKVQDAGRSGKLVIETTNLTFGYQATKVAGGDSTHAGALTAARDAGAGPTTRIVEGLTTTILRGDKVGIVGPNGAGKTTLVRLLLGDLAPMSGSVRVGTNIEPLYFDQVRGTLDPQKSVIENLSGGDEMVIVGGKAKHVNAYLKEFLFEPDRLRSPVGVLSGGEKNRLMLARLFLQPSNLLVMDEPTNDLDLETLDMLEQMLVSYPGTLLLVTHDRDLLDNVVTDCLVFTGPGRVEELAGGYSDWGDRVATAGPPAAGTRPDSTASAAKTGPAASPAAAERPRKLSFKETRELEHLPDRIASLEADIERLHAVLADPELYRNESERVAGLTEELTGAEKRLAEAYERWEELEAIAAAT